MSGYTILEKTAEKTKYGHPLWKCQCRCGKIKLLTSSEAKRTKSCINCCHRKYIGKISANSFHHAKSGAKRRKIEFNITQQDMWDKFVSQDGKCNLTGWDIDIADTVYGQRHGESTASLDRIDSDKGYEIDNIQWLHKDVNRLKQIFSQERTLEICKAIAEHNK